jgi:predicted MFS family arabinose efflux permease
MAFHALRGVHDAAPAASGGRSSRERLRDALIVGFGVVLLTGGLSSDGLPLMVGLGLPGFGLVLVAFRHLVPPGTLRLQPGYPSAVMLRGFLTFAFFCVDPYVALLLVDVRGWSAAAAGIALTAATISWTFGSWTQARLTRRIPHERFALLGFAVVAVGTIGLLPTLAPAVPAWIVVPVFAVAGYGMGLAYAQFALIVLRDVRAEEHGAVTSGLTLSDALGTALGVGVAAAFVAASERATGGPAAGIGAAIVLATLVALAGFALSPRLRARASLVDVPVGGAERVR